MEQHKIVIFSKTYCPHCTRAKAIFDKLGKAYHAIELDVVQHGREIQNYLAQKTGQRTVNKTLY